MERNPENRRNINELRFEPGEPGGPFIWCSMYNFGVGSAFPVSEHRAWMKEIAAPFLRQPGATFKVTGVASRSGNADFNKELSRKRMNMVINALLDLGAKPEQLVAADAQGEDLPAAWGEQDGKEDGEFRAVFVEMSAQSLRSSTRGFRSMLSRASR